MVLDRRTRQYHPALRLQPHGRLRHLRIGILDGMRLVQTDNIPFTGSEVFLLDVQQGIRYDDVA